MSISRISMSLQMKILDAEGCVPTTSSVCVAGLGELLPALSDFPSYELWRVLSIHWWCSLWWCIRELHAQGKGQYMETMCLKPTLGSRSFNIFKVKICTGAGAQINTCQTVWEITVPINELNPHLEKAHRDVEDFYLFVSYWEKLTKPIFKADTVTDREKEKHSPFTCLQFDL